MDDCGCICSANRCLPSRLSLGIKIGQRKRSSSPRQWWLPGPPPNNPAEVWGKGIVLNAAECRAAVFAERFCVAFERGVDIMLDRVWARSAHKHHDNYASLDSQFCSPAEAELRLRTHIDEGFAEIVANEPVCVHPLGAVPAEGDKRFRLIMDCTASGLNACIVTTDPHVAAYDP